MQRIVAAMSLAVYQGISGEHMVADVWGILEQGCKDLATLAEASQEP